MKTVMSGSMSFVMTPQAVSRPPSVKKTSKSSDLLPWEHITSKGTTMRNYVVWESEVQMHPTIGFSSFYGFFWHLSPFLCQLCSLFHAFNVPFVKTLSKMMVDMTPVSLEPNMSVLRCCKNLHTNVTLAHTNIYLHKLYATTVCRNCQKATVAQLFLPTTNVHAKGFGQSPQHDL